MTFTFLEYKYMYSFVHVYDSSRLSLMWMEL